MVCGTGAGPLSSSAGTNVHYGGPLSCSAGTVVHNGGPLSSSADPVVNDGGPLSSSAQLTVWTTTVQLGQAGRTTLVQLYIKSPVMVYCLDSAVSRCGDFDQTLIIMEFGIAPWG